MKAEEVPSEARSVPRSVEATTPKPQQTCIGSAVLELLPDDVKDVLCAKLGRKHRQQFLILLKENKLDADRMWTLELPKKFSRTCRQIASLTE